MLLSEYIRRERERRGWRQEHFAELVGVDASTVRRWEKGEREPVAYHLLKIQALIGLPPAEPQERKQKMDSEPSTYFIKGSSLDEAARLEAQAHMVTHMQGGPLKEQPDLSPFRHVLDIGSGTGHWLVACARAYPEMERLVGIDNKHHMVDYARERAASMQVSDRVEFHVMDALGRLDQDILPDASFDLVNVRFAVGWIRAFENAREWKHVTGEMARMLRTGGVARLVDAQYVRTNLPWVARYWELGLEAACHAGYLPEGVTAITELFPDYLADAGFKDVHSRVVDATYRQGTPEFALFASNVRHLVDGSGAYFRRYVNIDSHVREWGLVDCQQFIDAIYNDLERDGAEVTQPILTAWGVK